MELPCSIIGGKDTRRSPTSKLPCPASCALHRDDPVRLILWGIRGLVDRPGIEPGLAGCKPAVLAITTTGPNCLTNWSHAESKVGLEPTTSCRQAGALPTELLAQDGMRSNRLLKREANPITKRERKPLTLIRGYSPEPFGTPSPESFSLWLSTCQIRWASATELDRRGQPAAQFMTRQTLPLGD